MNKNKNLHSIQAMRGMAALFVVLFHCRVYLNNTYAQSNLGDILFSYGYAGVDLFFIISGFIISYATIDKEKDSGLKYLIKRSLRIYPVYLTSLFLLCIFRGLDFSALQLTGGYTVDNIIKSIFLIPLDLNATAPYYGYSLLIVAWTLTYEVIFYFIFFIGMSINHNNRTLISSAIILFGLIVTSILSGNFSLIPEKHTFHIKWIELITNPINLNFVLGIISYHIFIKISDTTKKTTVITSLSKISLGFSVLLISNASLTGHGVTRFGFISFIVFLSILFLVESGELKTPKWTLFLGDISYSLYLSHIIIIYSLDKYTTSFPLIGGSIGWSKLIGVLIFSIMLATVMNRIIEKPFINLVRAIINKKIRTPS